MIRAELKQKSYGMRIFFRAIHFPDINKRQRSREAYVGLRSFCDGYMPHNVEQQPAADQ